MKRFYLPTEIITGRGCFQQLGQVARRHGERALLVCGAGAMRRSGVLDRGLELLAQRGISATVYDKVIGEPTLPVVEEGRKLAREQEVQRYRWSLAWAAGARWMPPRLLPACTFSRARSLNTTPGGPSKVRASPSWRSRRRPAQEQK